MLQRNNSFNLNDESVNVWRSVIIFSDYPSPCWLLDDAKDASITTTHAAIYETSGIILSSQSRTVSCMTDVRV